MKQAQFSFFLLFSGMLLGGPYFAVASSKDTAITVANYGLKSMINQVKKDYRSPWLDRTEVDLYYDDSIFNVQLLTVQPLYESPSEDHTIFTQISGSYRRKYDVARLTTNTGIGYRYLSLKKDILLGINLFTDYEWGYRHARIGIGTEAKIGNFDFTVNYYDALSSRKTISDSTSGSIRTVITEQAMDGADIELSSPLPYLPWTRFYTGYYAFRGYQGASIKRLKYSLEAKIAPNITMEAGFYNPVNTSLNDHFIEVRYQLGFGDTRPALFASKTPAIASVPFGSRNLAHERLSKVRRENDIRVERVTTTTTSGGSSVVVSGQ